MSVTQAPSPSTTGRPTRVRHLVLASLLVIAAINYVQRNSISPAEKTIRDELHLKITDTGNAMFAFFLAYAFFQVPSGWLAQRWGPRRALPFYAAGWSVMTGLCALATGAFGLIAARLALGVLQAGIFPCCTLILVAWYPASRRGLSSALLNSSMRIGGAVGTLLTGALLEPLGWRWVFALYAMPGLVWAFWFLWWFRNRPEEHPEVNAAELAVIAEAPAVAPDGSAKAGDPARGPVPWAAILGSTALILVCCQQCCNAGANRFFDMWLVTYLQETHNLKPAEASALASWPQWIAICGGLLGGALSDAVLRRTRSRRAARNGVSITGLVAAILCYSLAYSLADLRSAIAVLSLGAFFLAFSSPISYAVTMDLGGRNVAIVFGIMNMAGNLGAAALIWVLAQLKEETGNWNAGLVVFVGTQVVAVLCWLLLNPNGVIGEPSPARADE